MIGVAPTGVTSSHHVRGVGHHDHTEYVTDDACRVVVSEFRKRTDPLTVTWWTTDGQRHEIRERGSARWVLMLAGFRLAEE